MKPIRYWFNGGYADFRVPEGADEGFQGNVLRIGGEADVHLRISVMRTRSARNGGPATAEEAIRLTRFAGAGTIECLDGNRAVLTHTLPPEEGGDNLVSHVWHLALKGSDDAIVVAIFSVAIDAGEIERPATQALLEVLAAEVRAARFLFFDEPASGKAADLEDG